MWACVQAQAHASEQTRAALDLRIQQQQSDLANMDKQRQQAHQNYENQVQLLWPWPESCVQAEMSEVDNGIMGCISQFWTSLATFACPYQRHAARHRIV